MKTLCFALVFLTGSYCYAQYAPDTSNFEGSVSAMAAKFSDVYIVNHDAIDHFIIGSNAEEDFKKRNIEEIRFILPDGFIKVFSFLPHPARKIESIEPTGLTTSVIHYKDSSASIVEMLFCPGHPIAYQIMYKKTI